MGIGQRCSVRRGPRHRASEAISRARLGANSAHAERRSAERSTIVTSPGPRTTAHVKPSGESRRHHARSATIVEAGGFAVKRSSTWKAHSASGSAGSQPTAAGFRPRVSPHARHGASKDVPRLESAPGIGQSVGAREESRLQKSVRRIFLAASRGSSCWQRRVGPRGGAR